jgi:hypothetical protein
LTLLAFATLREGNMLRRPTEDGITAAARRPLKIFASDPLLGRTFGNRARIDIVNERLAVGPVGNRVEVIDYDGAQKCYYAPINLDHPAVLMQGGLEPSESDPRFHQQMVYAVAMKTLENFDRALGRVLRLGSRVRKAAGYYPRLRLFPHAFYGANAYYDPSLNAVLFGYFKAEAEDVGPNLPGQTVFTCLSHDVIAHEMTHAIVDRLRPLFLEPSNLDVLAFHEGFADIVAMFQHFSFQDVLREQIQRTRLDIRSPTSLVQLAQQFGYATGGGKALRSALDAPGSKLRDTIVEPHERGSILVAAVFDGFFKTYQRRIGDLVRIATGGTGTLPQGDLHPDLVNRIATEAARTAQRVLDMCIRAFDYMPPVDVTFGDFLRAMITADFELVPDDEFNCRSAMIEAFRLRGIYPDGVTSLAEESLLWENVENTLPQLPPNVLELLELVFFNAVRSFDLGWENVSYQPTIDEASQSMSTDEGEEIELDVNKELATALHDYARDNAPALGLDPGRKIQVRGFHPVFRVAPSGRLLIELVIQYTQVDHSVREDLGGLPFRGGCTLIASSNGVFRYLISKPMQNAGGDARRAQAGAARLTRQQDYVRMCDMANAQTPYYTQAEHRLRMLELMNFASLHGG